MAQLRLNLGADPIAALAGYLGGSTAMLDEAARSFLCDGRVTLFPIDVPRAVLTEAAAAIWTPDELAELRELQAALRAHHYPAAPDSDVPDVASEDARRAWLAAWKAECLCRARLIRRVSPYWAAYWEGGWR